MDSAVVNTIAEYIKSQPVDKAWLFGSFSRGEERADSDVDILVSLTPCRKIGLAFFGMVADLEERLGRPVDLVVDGDLLPFAQGTANRDKILIYERS